VAVVLLLLALTEHHLPVVTEALVLLQVFLVRL
jgi:hypothetical protein